MGHERSSPQNGVETRASEPNYVRASVDSLAALAPLFFLCRLRGLFLFGASGSGALLMDAFFSATLSRPPLEGPLAWVVPALGERVCHGGNMHSIFPTSPHPCMATR